MDDLGALKTVAISEGGQFLLREDQVHERLVDLFVEVGSGAATPWVAPDISSATWLHDRLDLA